MPTSEKGRRAAFAELSRRGEGKKPRMFEGMGEGELRKYAYEPLHKGKSKSKKRGRGRQTPREMAAALRAAD